MLARLKHILKRILFRPQLPPPQIVTNIQFVKPEKQLAGRTALITGGTSGIGLAIAKAFHDAGATVVITGRDEAKSKRIASTIGDTNIFGIGMDMTDTSSFGTKINSINEMLGDNRHIDILVNNAGCIGGDIRWGTEEEFDRVIDTNLKGTFYLSKLIATEMVRNGIKGNILNVASSSSLRPATSAYTLSKWGIRGLTLGLAKMLVPHGIVVNGVAPGPTATPMLGKKDYSDIALPTSPIGRYALPEEIAAMALFLCGSMGRTIVGDIVYMTGGAGVIEYNDMNFEFNV